MQTIVWIAIAVAILIVVGLAVAFLLPRQRSRSLRARFGPEYDRTVSTAGDQRQAERELAAREERRRRFEIRDLEPEMRARYLEDWRGVQAHFVDSPPQAVRAAGIFANRFQAQLAEEIMSEMIAIAARQGTLQPGRQPAAAGSPA